MMIIELILGKIIVLDEACKASVHRANISRKGIHDAQYPGAYTPCTVSSPLLSNDNTYHGGGDLSAE